MLDPAETKEVASTEQKRNALACESGWGICDRSLLKVEEARTGGNKPTS